MLNLVISESHGDTQHSSSVQSVLAQWASFALLKEFIWIEKQGDSFKGTLYHNGGVKSETELAPLLAYHRGEVRVVTVSIITGEHNDCSAELEFASQISQLLKAHVQAENIVKDIHVIVPCEIGVPIKGGLPERSRYIWSAEDRFGIDFASTLLQENLPFHAAHGICSLAEIWEFDDSPEMAFHTREGQGNTLQMSRGFVRFLIFPEIRHDLLSDLPIRSDEVILVSQQFERTDLCEYFIEMSKRFVEKHEACLGRSDVSDLLASEDPKIPERSLRSAVQEQLHFMFEFFAELPSLYVELFSERIYNFLRQKFSGGLPVFSWSTALGSDQDDLQSLKSAEKIRPASINDGPLGAMWIDLQEAVCSLIDGTTFDWGDSLPPSSGGRSILSDSRSAIVGNPTSVGKAQNSSIDAESSRNLLVIDPSLRSDPEIDEINSEDSWLAVLKNEIKSKLDLYQQDLDVFTSKLEAIDHEFKSGLTDSLNVFESMSWRARLKNLFRKRSERLRPATTRMGLLRSLRKRSVLGFVLGILLTGLAALFVSPIVAITAAVSSLIATVASLYRRAWAAHLELLRAKAQHEARLAQRQNIETQIAYLKADILRVKRRFREFDFWEKILCEITMCPYQAAIVSPQDAVPPNWMRPISIGVGQAIVETGRSQLLAREFRDYVFSKGWLKRRFEELKKRFLIENLGSSTLEIENDSSEDEKSVLHEFFTEICNNHFPQSDSREILDKVTDFLGGKKLTDIVDRVRILQNESLRQLSDMSVEDFLGVQKENGKFLEGEFSMAIDQLNFPTVQNNNIKTFGAVSMENIRVPSESDDWKVPFLAAGVVHFTDEIEEDRVKGLRGDR